MDGVTVVVSARDMIMEVCAVASTALAAILVGALGLKGLEFAYSKIKGYLYDAADHRDNVEFMKGFGSDDERKAYESAMWDKGYEYVGNDVFKLKHWDNEEMRNQPKYQLAEKSMGY